MIFASSGFFSSSSRFVSGLCWRYDLGVRETIKRIQEGAIGDIIAIQENYLTSTLWLRERKKWWIAPIVIFLLLLGTSRLADRLLGREARS